MAGDNNPVTTKRYIIPSITTQCILFLSAQCQRLASGLMALLLCAVLPCSWTRSIQNLFSLFDVFPSQRGSCGRRRLNTCFGLCASPTRRLRQNLCLRLMRLFFYYQALFMRHIMRRCLYVLFMSSIVGGFYGITVESRSTS